MEKTTPTHRVPIEDSLDLHTFAPRDLVSAVEAYLEEAYRLGLREVRLIHGKGRGFAKARVAAVLARLPYVAAAYEAPPERGGWGATVVILRQSPQPATAKALNQDPHP